MKKIYYLGIALAACLSSCSDDSLDNGKAVVNPVQTGDEIIFGSSLSDNTDMESRTEYGDRTATGVPVYWSSDEEKPDTIAIYCMQSSQPADHLVKYIVTPSESNQAVAASVDKLDPNAAGLQWGDRSTPHRFYAFYPAGAVKGTDDEDATGQITANIPVTQQVQEWRTVQAGASGALEGKKTYFGLPNMDYAYMYAYNEVTPENMEGSTVNLKFKNLVTVLDITVQGPQSGTATITNINVDAVEGSQPILTGDFKCNIRAAKTDGTVVCTPVGSFNEERGRISIPCYDKKSGQFIQLGPNELLNVKAYIIPQNKNTVTRHTLRVTVSMLNGAPCRKTLNTADVTPHKINRVILPKLEVGGTNYWMSSLDPNIYVSELSIPGSKFSILSKANRASRVYQNYDIDKQFEDGVRAFIFQTATNSKDLGANYDNLYVVCEDKSRNVMTLSQAIKKIASYLDVCEQNGKTNEFAFVMLTYSSGDIPWLDNPQGYDNEQYWIDKLREEVNSIADDEANRIYTGEITPNTTINDVKGKIILKANYNSKDMISRYGTTTAPIMFTWWKGAYGPELSEGVYYQEVNNGMPMDWGAPVWYENSNAALRWYYQEVTSVGSGQEATTQKKKESIQNLFRKSVDLYKNDTSHKTWFMNDLGGYYSDSGDIKGRGTGIEALAIDMNQMGVDELQDRTENAGLGLVFMNFADKQSNSGARYKSDWLIQTLIDNNFKFALRKKGSTTTTTSYNASYKTGVNAIGWDK